MSKTMRIFGLIMLAAVMQLVQTTSLLAGDAPSGPKADPLGKPPFGSIARQKLLQFRLKMLSDGSLVASIDHNHEAWKNLSPDQREQYRHKAYAFLKKNPKQQDKMLRDYEKFIRLNAAQREAYRRRAAWLKVVVRTFSAKQREELREMSPEDRARKLIERRDQLVREGKLKLREPTSKPASAPAEEGNKPPAGGERGKSSDNAVPKKNVTPDANPPRLPQADSRKTSHVESR